MTAGTGLPKQNIWDRTTRTDSWDRLACRGQTASSVKTGQSIQGHLMTAKSALVTSFSKNAIKQWFINYILPNFQVMLISLCLFRLLKEMVARWHHGFTLQAELPASLCHSVPGEGSHHLVILAFRESAFLWWCFIDISFTNASNIMIQGVAVRAVVEGWGRPPWARTLGGWLCTSPGWLWRCDQGHHPAERRSGLEQPLCPSRASPRSPGNSDTCRL
jgi:hypothetical protein